MTKKTRNDLLVAFGVLMIVVGIFAAKFLINVHYRIKIKRTQAARNGVKEIQQAVQIYSMQHQGRGPAGIEDLMAGTDDKPPLLKPYYRVDPWRTPYRIEKIGKAWWISSAGPDRKFDTKDDVTSEKHLEFPVRKSNGT